MKAQVHDNANWRAARPRLSVLIPFLRDDPGDLIRRLDAEAETLGGAVELVLLDDGTGDAALAGRLTAQVAGLGLPARLIVLADNEGRSRGRNRLASAARGSHLLFLDSDMRPDSPAFLRTWIELIGAQDPAVAFGGFSLDQAPDEPRFAVHRALALKSECVPQAERARAPEKYVYTSNLLVRRDVFAAEAFDPDFTGWGWEDVEWGIRVSRRFAIVHLDNPATHMGLDTAAALAAKYAQSGPNFARVVARHPDVISAYPSYRAARALKRLPLGGALRGATRAVAEAETLPVAARAFALRLFRAFTYAEALP